MLESVDPRGRGAAAKLLLLPGFDGTGELFAPLVSALGSDHDALAVRYRDEVQLDDYVESVSAALPSEGAILIAESFSGPIALALMARYPSGIRCALLCATFAVSPFRSLTRLARFVPSPLFGPSPTQPTMLRAFCLDRQSDSGLLPRAVAVIRSVSSTTIKARGSVFWPPSICADCFRKFERRCFTSRHRVIGSLHRA